MPTQQQEIRISVDKAQPTFSQQKVPDVRIEITETLPDFVGLPLEEWDCYCDAQAAQVERALHEALPGGTYDRLLGHMLQRRASHLRVAFAEAAK